MEHAREGKHPVRSPKQAIAIGLSKARRAGVALPPPRRGKATAATRRKAAGDVEAGEGKRPRARAAGPKTGTATAKRGAPRRTSADSSAAAKKGAATRRRKARAGREVG